MATWTEKQIAALTGPSLELYKKLIAKGMRPADALNQVIKTYGSPTGSQPPSTTSYAQFRSAEAVAGGDATATEQQIAQTLDPFNIQTSRFEPENVQPAFEGTGQYSFTPAPNTQTPQQKWIVSTFVDAKGNLIGIYSDGTTVILKAAETGPTAEQRSAFALLKDQLESWGLGGLADWAIGLYQSESAPASYNEFYALMKQQPIYQERFGKTNAARTAAGLAQLSEGEIMKLEAQYKNIMKSYNMPANFYDTPEDYRTFIANDLSAAELADRVQAANAYVKLQDQNIKNQLRQYYGIDDSALAAYALDPKKGQDIINALASKTTSRIAAATAGLGEAEAQLAMSMGSEDLSFSRQAQAFGGAAQAGTEGARLSAIYGGQGAQRYGTSEAIGEFFAGPTAVAESQKRKKLSRMEQNVFGGSSGVGASSLGGSGTAGAL